MMSNTTWFQTEAIDLFCGSPFWDTNLTWYTDNPTFTPCLEKTLLVWIPAVFLWIFAPMDVYFQTHNVNRNIPWNWKNISKCLINIAICTICIVDFAHSIRHEVDDKVDIFMPLFKLITFALALLLAYRNKVSGIPSSGIVFLFWFLNVLCGIPQYRSEIQYAQNGFVEGNYYEYMSYMLYYPSVIVMFLLNCLGEGHPKEFPYRKFAKKLNPEPTASFLSKITYCYVDSFMFHGYRKPVESKDLWDLEQKNTSTALVTRFEEKFSRRLEISRRVFQKKYANVKASFGLHSGSAKVTTNKDHHRPQTALVPILWICVWRSFIFGLLIRTFGDVIQFANPKLLGIVIAYTKSPSEPIWKGYLYAFSMFVVAFIMTICNTSQSKLFMTIGLQVRSTLMAAIYRKALRISNSARKNRTVGQIVNLMSADAQKFQELVMFLNFLWSAPVSIVLAMVFLYQELGVATFAGLAILMSLLPINALIIRKSKQYQAKLMKLTDERVKITNEVLNGIKVLKLYAWEASFEQQLIRIRSKEISTLRKSFYLNAVSMFIWQCSPFIVSCICFAVYVMIDDNNVLDAPKAFVSLALLNLLRMPMSMLPNIINQLVQTWVSVRRITSFLNEDDLESYVTHDYELKDTPVVIENGTFSWDVEPILKDINMKVTKNSLTAVVGAVGSGKSSLISTILGETNYISGKINTYGEIAYVPQQAWIQNATVRDNITFGKPYDKLKYERIVEACALKSDFQMLANGEQTEIGEKGINLSGGQKQRISLARSVYADADIYLLDDPLSAVDSHVGKHIFTNLIGPEGLLRNKTRLLITHAITYLPQTDFIIVLEKGQVSETGSYEQLLEKQGPFSDFIQQHIIEQVEDEDKLAEIEQQLSKVPIRLELSRSISRQRSRLSESGSVGSEHELNGLSGSRESIKSNSSMKRTPSLTRRKVSKGRKFSSQHTAIPMKNVGPDRKGKLIDEEKIEKGNVKWSVFMFYFKAVGLSYLCATLFGYSCFQGFYVGSSMWLGKWSEDDTIYVDGTVNTTLRDQYIIIYGLLGVGLGLSMLSSNITFTTGVTKAAKNLHNYVLRNVLRLPMSFFDTTPSGRILNRFSGDIVGIDFRLPMAFNVFFQNILRVLSTLAVICYTTPMFTIPVLPLIALYAFIQRYYVATSRQLRRIDATSKSPIYSQFGETLSGTHVIRAYGHSNRFISIAEAQIDKNQKAIYPTNEASLWLTVRLETIGSLIIFFAVLFAIMTKDLNPALVGLSVSYSMNITNTLNFMVRMISDVETTIVSVERIKEYGEAKQEAAWDIAEKKPSDSWPEKGVVEFKDFSVRYRAELDLVLKGISFHIDGGERIGIVGRTGAGKSSLTLGLFRIIEAAGGSIYIDGKNIGDLGIHDVRSRLTIIPQDAVLFSGTLRMNLDPFEKYSDDDVWRALELAHLKEFTSALSEGLQYKVSEGGENLSAGQRQLVCLARALLRKTRILILDEATAAVDLETDDLIQNTIRTAFNECTVLTIAHRLNTIIDSDRVLVLDQGKVAEFNTPDTLLANEKTIFYGMCKDAGLVH